MLTLPHAVTQLLGDLCSAYNLPVMGGGVGTGLATIAHVQSFYLTFITFLMTCCLSVATTSATREANL